MNITNEWVDPDDAPELDRAWFDKATVKVAGEAVNRGGRPRGSNKEQVALRIDKDVLDRFRADGPGWQSRMNRALRTALGL